MTTLWVSTPFRLLCDHRSYGQTSHRFSDLGDPGLGPQKDDLVDKDPRPTTPLCNNLKKWTSRHYRKDVDALFPLRHQRKPNKYRSRTRKNSKPTNEIKPNTNNKQKSPPSNYT